MTCVMTIPGAKFIYDVIYQREVPLEEEMKSLERLLFLTLFNNT